MAGRQRAGTCQPNSEHSMVQQFKCHAEHQIWRIITGLKIITIDQTLKESTQIALI